MVPHLTALDLASLDTGLPGLSPRWGGFLHEAGAVCLHKNGHATGVLLRIRGIVNIFVPLTWRINVTPQVLASWEDEQELAEHAASGLAVVLILSVASRKVIRRAKKGSHVDYWLADASSVYPFQDSARLEVSGILHGSDAVLDARVRQKVNQASSGPSPLPAYVVVVEFGTPQSQTAIT